MIYFIQAGAHGPIKIGYTANDPWRRMDSLQASTADELRLLAVTGGRLADERRLHRRLAGDRIRREWFRPSVAVALAIMAAKDPPPRQQLRAADVLRRSGYLTPSEAARKVGVDQSTIHRWAGGGMIPSQRVGRRLFVEVRDA